jgi:hypothetical protein
MGRGQYCTPSLTSFVQALVDQFPVEESDVKERMLHIFSIALPSKWEMERELARRFMSLGVVLSALAIFERLQMWEDVVLCHTMTEKKEKVQAYVCDGFGLF